MALLAPMPMASIIAATAVNAGSRRSTRAAYRKSCQRVIMDVGRWRRAVVSLTGNEGRGLPGGAADFPQSAHAKQTPDVCEIARTPCARRSRGHLVRESCPLTG